MKLTRIIFTFCLASISEGQGGGGGEENLQGRLKIFKQPLNEMLILRESSNK